MEISSQVDIWEIGGKHQNGCREQNNAQLGNHFFLKEFYGDTF